MKTEKAPPRRKTAGVGLELCDQKPEEDGGYFVVLLESAVHSNNEQLNFLLFPKIYMGGAQVSRTSEGTRLTDVPRDSGFSFVGSIH